MKLFTPIISFLFLVFSTFSFSQSHKSSNQKSSKWSINPFEQKVFIENNGQFAENNETNDKILFQSEVEGVKMCFTKQGLVYHHDEIIAKKEKEDDGEDDEDAERKINVIPHSVSVQWLGSNPAVKVTAEDKVSFFYSYSFDPKKEKEGIKASSYKKIIYHDLYPNIDVEYILPEKKGGIKYSLILHPGANISDIKMKWSGEGISKDASGNVIVKSSFGDFVDHAPATFYAEGGFVASSFELQNNILTFSVPNFESLRTVIIDPWTSSPTFTMNSAYDVNYDFAGNVYAFGSSGTFQEAKFNSAGALQWVFNASSVSTFGYYGDFAVDGTSGTSYLGEGFNSSGAQIAKVNSAGTQVGLYPGYANMREIWRMDYNYCNGTVLIGGGGTSSPSYQAFILDTNLITITPVQVVSTLPDIDAALLSTDKFSNFGYILFARIYGGGQPTLDNLLVKCPLPGLLPTTWGTLTTHSFVEVSSVTYVSSGVGMANGMNGLAISPNFVYTYDGSIIKKWNKTSGALVSTLTVSGTLFSWGGLDVDECDNLYVGVQNAINVYDVNWAPVTTYPVSSTVYDLKLSGSKLYACGNGFVSEIDLTASTHSLTSTPATCSLCNGTATAPACSSTGFSYLWTPGGQTTQTATGLCPGTYSVTVSTNCTRVSVDTVTIHSTNIIPVSFVTANICLGQPTTFTDNTPASSGTLSSWSWNFGDGNTSNLQNPSHTYSASGTYTVTMNATSTLGCVGTTVNTVTVYPQPTANFSATTVCLGNPTIFSDQSTGGGTTWSWNFGNGSTSTLQNPTNTYTASGNYSVTEIVTGVGGCTSTIIHPVTVYPQPLASFTATTVCLHNPTQFTDQSTGGGTIWNWNFGDGNTSTLQNPTHTYSTSGTFTATLNVSVTGGCNSTATQVITISALPVSDFSATTVCFGNATQFADLSTGATAWSWNFGNGNTSVTQNPSTTYSASGTYSVSLITTTVNGCKDTIAKTVTVNALPVASFTASPICLNTPPMVFNNQSTGGTQWSWNFGDGSPISVLQNPSHTYVAAGNYSVTLIATTVNGCKDTTSQTITINPVPTPSFTVTNVCFNNITPFTDQSTGAPIQWAWNFGDGNNSAQQNPSHTYNAPGSYFVTLVISNSFGCKDSISHNITIYPLPTVSFSAPVVCITNQTCFQNSSSITSGTLTGWSWNFGEPTSPTNISNIQNPCHTYTSSGTFQVFLTVTSNNGCQSTTNQSVVVQPPPVAAFTAQNSCLNSPTVFTNNSTGATQWNWAFGDGNNSALQNPTHTYPGYGTYVSTLIVTSLGGCTDTTMDTIKIYPLPIVNFSADTVCFGKTTSFTGFSFIPSGNVTSWSWNFGDAASGANNTSSLQNPTHVFTQAGTFSVTLTVTSDKGCISTLSLQVVVHPLPTAGFSFKPGPIVSVTDNIAFTDLSSGGVVNWTWNFGDSSALSHAQNPNHVFADTGTYIITQIVVSQYGCVDSIKHVLETKGYSFYIPNAFTPNGDGKNEFFFGKGIGITQYEMWIFDRWGNLIFYCTVDGLPQSQPCMWDGTVKGGSGIVVQEDVYVWKVHLTNVFNNSFDYIGTVTVVK